MAEDKDEGATPPGGTASDDTSADDGTPLRAKDVVGAKSEEPLRAKDLLFRGELGTDEVGSERFGSSVMRRRFRRPVGNSEKLWKKVDGEDPWDLPKPKKPAKKQRGVYAAGRFVRVDKAEAAKGKPKDASSHIPEWARQKAKQREQAQAEPEVKATPTSEDPLQRLMQTIAQKNAEADAKRDKGNDAASRMRKAQGQSPSGPQSTERALPDQAPPPPSAPQPGKRATRSGRLRTSHSTGRVRQQRARKAPENRAYATGRGPEKPRGPVKDLPVEMRRPPRVDPNASSKPERVRGYAAGRGPDRNKKPAKEIPLEMRRPPRVDPNAKAPDPAQVARSQKLAAGRTPDRRKPASKKDLPVEMRRPPHPGGAQEAEPAPVEPTKPAPAKSTKPQAPIDRTPPKPKPPAAKPGTMPSLGGSSGGMDDLFGMASSEGPMRIGRRRKKTAASEGDEGAKKKAAPSGPRGSQKPPVALPKAKPPGAEDEED